MRDRELSVYEILYGGCMMALPLFFCPKGNDWRLLLLFLASFCLFEMAIKKKSILLYLLLWAALGFLLPRTGRDLVEKACILGGVIIGGVGYFWGRWKGYYGFFSGPAYPALGIPVIVYVVAYVEKFEYLKGRSCLFAAAVVLLCMLSRNREALLIYVKENEKLHRFPGKRLEKKNRHTMALFFFILAVVMTFAYWKGPDDPVLQEVKQEVVVEEMMEKMEQPQSEEMDMSKLLGDEEQKEPPAWLTALENILYWLISAVLLVGMIALVVYGIYRLVFGYRNQYDNKPLEKNTFEEDVMEDLAPPKFSIPKFFRRKTPAEQIRKYYKKWVLSGPGQTPGASQTPTEAEREAKVCDEELHTLYEKARYSSMECTGEELGRIRRKQS